LPSLRHGPELSSHTEFGGLKAVWRERWYRATRDRDLTPLTRRASDRLPVFADLVAVLLAAVATGGEVRADAIAADSPQ
jgi:hypothetical protein